MSTIIVSQIKKDAAGSSWYTLRTPITMSFKSDVIDANTSGRDTNTGLMFRDIVREDVLTVQCTLPAGITNLEMVDILDIIQSHGFYAKIPDPRTGTFTTNRHFYCATMDYQIDKILSETTQSLWVYKECSFDAIEY